MGTLELKVLVDNYACMGSGRGIWAEHGLSYWLETEGERVLFDTGASGTVLLHNAPRMGVDLATADAIVLSHGHLDHVGGLESVLPLATEAALFMHPAVPRPKFTGKAGHVHRSDSAFVLEKRFEDGRRVIRSNEALEILPGIWMTGEIPRKHAIEDTGGPFCIDAEATQPDPIPDDQSLFLPTPEGTLVILGCAHAGIINTLDYVRKLTGNAPLRCVVGGTHLENASEERMEWTIAALKRLRVPEIHPCHCTGMKNAVSLSEAVGGASCPAYAGFKISL